MKSSDHDFLFKINSWVVNGIEKFTRKKLIKEKEMEEKSSNMESSPVNKE